MGAQGRVAEIRPLRQPVAAPPLDAEWRKPETYLQGEAAGATPAARIHPFPVAAGWPAVRVRASRLDAWLELALAASGVALAAFMVLHLALLATAMLGAPVMDGLALLLERYYLLHSAAPVLVVVLAAHVALALRKAPASARAQAALARQMRTLRHPDTWMWAVQLATGAALVVLASVHLWVILTDLPIQSAKSAGRISGVYLWLYVPLLLLVEAHASAGIYRIAVKWSAARRAWAHAALALWMLVFLSLGFAVLATFYFMGVQS